jgi:hypothetical protein
MIEGAPEHLTAQQSDRGFTYLPPIPVWSGYDFAGAPKRRPLGPMDFEHLAPHKVGEISAYESSDAVFPSIWVRMKVFNQHWAGDLRTFDEAVMLTVENARKLGEQLIKLADEHYNNGLA